MQLCFKPFIIPIQILSLESKEKITIGKQYGYTNAFNMKEKVQYYFMFV